MANKGEIETIKNGNHEITPSMVYFKKPKDKKPVRHVGYGAEQNLTRPSTAVDVQLEFKREMGQETMRNFQHADPMSPPELSAVVLRALRDAAAQRFGDAPGAAVITIPAMFELPQSDATMQAAKLAGFDHAILLQEPVAAATAYGFQTDADRAYWLVYDYGGGTFDVSVLAVRDGQLSVVKHDGDNYLGGADFDRLIVDEWIIPKLEEDYEFEDLSRSNKDNDNQGRLAVLRKHAEAIKKALSNSSDETYYVENVFQDDNGDDVDIELEVNRAAFEVMIRPMVDKTIKIAQRLLQDEGLEPSDIDKVLLVGGSTFVPLVQQQVATLGIPVDRSIDPMTVVSRGAAVFASSKRIPKELVAQVPVEAGAATLDLEYAPVGKDLTPPVMGRVAIEGGASAAGCTVALEREDGGWSSGKLLIDGKGRFFTNVQLREKGQSEFRITVRDASDQQLTCATDSIAITYGMSVARAQLPQAVSVALADGTADILIEGGKSLPENSKRFDYKTTKSIAKGSDDVLTIAFMAGDEKEAEQNRVGSQFQLKGTEIPRDLPAGSDVEIVAAVDESQVTTFTITVPLLDEQFEVKGRSNLKHEAPEVMRERLGNLKSKLADLEEKAAESDQDGAQAEVEAFSESDDLDDISEQIDKAEDEEDGVQAGQARQKLVDAAKKVKDLEAKVEWPARVNDYEEAKTRARTGVHEFGGTDEQQMLTSVIDEGDKAVAAKDPRMLERATMGLRQIGYAMSQQDPAFLGATLAYLFEKEDEFTDRRKARSLLNDGAMALKRRDTEAMKSIIQELYRLLPAGTEQSASAAIQSDII